MTPPVVRSESPDGVATDLPGRPPVDISGAIGWSVNRQTMGLLIPDSRFESWSSSEVGGRRFKSSTRCRKVRVSSAWQSAHRKVEVPVGSSGSNAATQRCLAYVVSLLSVKRSEAVNLGPSGCGSSNLSDDTLPREGSSKEPGVGNRWRTVGGPTPKSPHANDTGLAGPGKCSARLPQPFPVMNGRKRSVVMKARICRQFVTVQEWRR